VKRLLVAPAGYGKTAHVIDAIRALPPLAHVRVLLPDQIQAAAFRRRLADAGGSLGVEVQTFYGLYTDVLTLSGGALSIPQARPGRALARLTSSTRLRLIQYIAETLCDAGQLAYYSSLSHSPGFARMLGDLFGELKRARVFPEALELAMAESEPRLSELTRLYAAYQEWLLETGWVDADGQGWLAAIALEQNSALLSDLSLLVVDGFDEFNPTQLHLLRLLVDRAAETIVTLIGDLQNPDRLAHRRLARARVALSEALGLRPLSLSARATSTTPSLVHVEANLFEPNPTPIPVSDEVAFLETQNRAAEAREALRWLKARLVRERVRLSDVAIVARDIGPYRPFLEEAAAEFGMPLRFASGVGLRTNPCVAALLNLLTVPLGSNDWSPRNLLDLLTSPYLDWSGCGLMPGDADRLYDVARAGQVVSGLDQWREAFRRLGAHPGEEAPGYDEEEALAPRRLPTGAEAARLKTVFEKIVALVAPPRKATLHERVAWIEEFVGDDPASVADVMLDKEGSLRVVARARENPATAERDGAALRAFKDILRGLILADSLLNGGQDNPLPYERFITALVQAVDDATFTVPVQGAAILAASALEVRGLSFDSAALLGLAEGDFPRAEREDALLRESDRSGLAEQDFVVEPSLKGDEATFFYQAITRARRRLLICRPYLADDGQPWEASPYWFSVLGLFDNAPVIHLRPTDPVRDVASEQELAGAVPDDATHDAAMILKARLQTRASPWSGDLSAVSELLAARFGPGHPWSSSRLETYAKCPFYFWSTYAMELEPRELPQAGFDVLILGSIYHLVLERLYSRVPDGNPDLLRAELPDVARRVFDAAPGDYGFRPTPLWERQQEELTGVLRRTVEALIEATGEYEPLIQELPFGLKGHPPLVLNGEHPMHLRGYIDRVDHAPDGRLRIIDYKAGSTPISARALSDGHRLQLPLYALAAEGALDAEVTSGFYWHINSAKPSSLVLEKFDGGVPGAIKTACEYAQTIGAAVCAGQFAPVPPDDGCPAFCPAVTFCERYRARSW
jgi:ATP-dependent helicase/DNAse subunit B